MFSVLSVVSTILAVIVFSNPGIWNPDFADAVMKYTELNIDFTNIWIKVANGFIIVLIAACILEISSALYKGIKYNALK